MLSTFHVAQAEPEVHHGFAIIYPTHVVMYPDTTSVLDSGYGLRR